MLMCSIVTFSCSNDSNSDDSSNHSSLDDNISNDSNLDDNSSNDSSSDDNSLNDDISDDDNGMNIVLVTLLVITIIGLVTSIVINVFLVVKLKQSRCVIIIIHSLYVAIIEYLLQIKCQAT